MSKPSRNKTLLRLRRKRARRRQQELQRKSFVEISPGIFAPRAEVARVIAFYDAMGLYEITS